VKIVPKVIKLKQSKPTSQVVHEKVKPEIVKIVPEVKS
jgi:hypothetical protein